MIKLVPEERIPEHTVEETIDSPGGTRDEGHGGDEESWSLEGDFRSALREKSLTPLPHA